jgi:hypothetical protein
MSEETAVKRLWSQPDILHIEWSDGISSEFASLWLRDNLSEDRDPHSGQRHRYCDLPENPRSNCSGRNGASEHRMGNESGHAAFDLKWCRHRHRTAAADNQNSRPSAGSKARL